MSPRSNRTKAPIPKDPTQEHPVLEPSGEKSPHVGILLMSGPYVAQHKDEILDFIRGMVGGLEQGNQRAGSIRVLERPASSIKVTFTRAQLARDIGRSLQGKYMGELDVKLEDGGESVRVTWWR